MSALADRFVLLLRRPLTMLFVIGCGISMLVSGRVTARLVVDGALSFAFVPAAQVLAFAAVHRVRRAALPSPGTIDEYFRANQPWSWWLLAMTTFAMLVSPTRRGDLGPMVITAPLPIVLAAVVDWRFFRRYLGDTPGQAASNILWLRLIAWSLAMLYFFGPGSSLETFFKLPVEIVHAVGEWFGRPQ